MIQFGVPPILNSFPVKENADAKFRYYIMIRHVNNSHYHVAGLCWNKDGEENKTLQMVFTWDELPMHIKTSV